MQNDKEEDFGNIKKLIKMVQHDYPQFRVIEGKKFAFRPPKTIIVGPFAPFCELTFLHELGHALCGHKCFRLDLERIKIENEAWDKAKALAAIYKVPIDEDYIQDELDSYREWLHKKSRCPNCGLTRYQTTDSLYHCPRCESFAG